MVKSTVQEDLQQLQEEYRQGLPDRLRIIQALVHHIDSFDRDSDFDELIRHIHNLSGSAETFGYEPLSQISRSLEIHLREELQHEKSITSETDWRLRELTSAIERAVAGDPDYRQLLRQPVVNFHDEVPQRSTVYVVEDDVQLCRDIELQLHGFGYDLQFFNSAAEAKTAIEQQAPDVLIVDIVLPEGDLAGTELVDASGIGQPRFRTDGFHVEPLRLGCQARCHTCRG